MNDRQIAAIDRIARSAEKLGYHVMEYSEERISICYGSEIIAIFDEFSAFVREKDGTPRTKYNCYGNELITLYTRIDDFLLRKFRKIESKYMCVLNIFSEFDRIVTILQEYTQCVKQAEKKIRIMEIEDE